MILLFDLNKTTELKDDASFQETLDIEELHQLALDYDVCLPALCWRPHQRSSKVETGLI